MTCYNRCSWKLKEWKQEKLLSSVSLLTGAGVSRQELEWVMHAVTDAHGNRRRGSKSSFGARLLTITGARVSSPNMAGTGVGDGMP